MWVNATFNESNSTDIIYNKFCPLLYCKSGNKTVNIGEDPSKQCASNRTGILCGACMDSFSLAIGSSRCIECPNSHNVALLLAFAAAGVLLVFFILALNLTATQGLINGVIFYANIVWAYKIILFPADIGANFFIHISSSFYFLAQLGFWNRDLFLYWAGYLLEDMAAVSIPFLHLGHCWCYHCCLSLATPLASLTSSVAELFLF